MSGSDIVALAASIIALLTSLLSLFIGTRLAVRKDRRQLLWSKELDRLFDLEQLAGELVEEVGSYRALPPDKTSLIQRIRELHLAAGRLGRYPMLRNAIRDLHNTLERMIAAKQERDDERSVRAELGETFQVLLAACDNVTGRERENDSPLREVLAWRALATWLPFSERLGKRP